MKERTHHPIPDGDSVETVDEWAHESLRELAAGEAWMDLEVFRDQLAPLFLLARLEDAVSEVMAELVEAAYDAGHSWNSIAGAIGVSRQAVRKRFGPVVTDDLDDFTTEVALLLGVSPGSLAPAFRAAAARLPGWASRPNREWDLVAEATGRSVRESRRDFPFLSDSAVRTGKREFRLAISDQERAGRNEPD